MIRLYAIISAIILSVTSLHALEVIDSMSYALGHRLTISVLAGENSLMQDNEDFKDYIRGLENNLPDITQMNDSSYMMSYAIGGMEAIFLSDASSHSNRNQKYPSTVLWQDCVRWDKEQLYCLPIP